MPTGGFYSDIQLLWTFGDSEKEVKNLCTNHIRHHHFTESLPTQNYKVNGFVGGVVKPEMLKKDDDNNNTITLMANGRVFVEDVQKSIEDSKVFNSYLVGELQTDFFDFNENEDMAVSSRQGVNENDPRYTELLAFIKTRLAEIAKMWTEWRRDIGANDTQDEFPGVTKWIKSLSPRHQAKAKQLIGKVNTVRFQGTEDEQKSQKKEVIKHQILAFEKLKIQQNIEELNHIDIEQSIVDFKNILLSIEDIEANMHHDLLGQRLEVIRKLKDAVDNEVKERVVQEHIYDNLWLINPSWDHINASTEKEKTITEYLKKACPDTTEGARIDIGYRTTAGRYMVIELKKPGTSTSFGKLIHQGEKYYLALRKYFEDNPGSCPTHGVTPPIDIILLVSKRPPKTTASAELEDRKLDLINGQIKTYEDLINQSLTSYQEHLNAIKKVDKLRAILDEL